LGVRFVLTLLSNDSNPLPPLDISQQRYRLFRGDYTAPNEKANISLKDTIGPEIGLDKIEIAVDGIVIGKVGVRCKTFFWVPKRIPASL